MPFIIINAVDHHAIFFVLEAYDFQAADIYLGCSLGHSCQ